MELLVPAIAALAAAAVATVLALSRARRQLAETRTEMVGELAAAKQDNK